MTAAGRARGPYAKTADRRAEILEATVQVFAESGFHGGTIREVAQRVGISQAGLLHHFASKERLLEAVLTLRDDRAREQFNMGDPTGRALLEGFVDLVAFNATTPGLVALYAVLSSEATAPDHPGHGYFEQRYAMVTQVVAEAVRLGQERGELRGELDPQEVAQTMVALSDGLQIQWLYADGAFDMVGPIKTYVTSLMATEQP